MDNKERQIKERLSSYTAEPAADAFSRIAARLQREKRRRAGIIILAAGLIMGIAGLLFSSWWRNNQVPSENTPLKTARINQPLKEKPEAVENQEDPKFSHAEDDLSRLIPPEADRGQKPRKTLLQNQEPTADPGLNAVPETTGPLTLPVTLTVTEKLKSEGDVTDTPGQMSLVKINEIPVSRTDHNIRHSNEELPEKKSDSTLHKKIQWLYGLGFSPSLNAYSYFGSSTGAGADYAKRRASESKVNFGWQAMLHLGFVSKNNWEFLLSPVIQHFAVKETFVPSSVPPPTFLNHVDPAVSPTRLASTNNIEEAVKGQTYNNSFTYAGLGTSIYRRFQFGRFREAKIGLEIRTNRLVAARSLVCIGYDQYYYIKGIEGVPYKRWHNLAILRFGFIEPLSEKLELQITPSVFAGVQSMFLPGYIVAQKPFGAGIDFTLLWRPGRRQ